MIAIEYARQFITSFNETAGLFAIIAAIPAIISFCLCLSRSWFFLSKKAKELLDKMHKGNGEIKTGLASHPQESEKKVVQLFANGKCICKLVNNETYYECLEYENAIVELESKNYVQQRRNSMGDDFYTLTPKGKKTKKYY